MLQRIYEIGKSGLSAHFFCDKMESISGQVSFFYKRLLKK